MIVFIDDEKWCIEGYIDNFNNKEKNNKRYELKHFFYPIEAWEFLRQNRDKIDLIILDIALDYGDGNILSEEDGGVQFLKEINSEANFNKIPILIYSVVPKEEIEFEAKLIIENEDSIYYLNRNCKEDEFYDLVDRIIKKIF